MIKRRLVRLAVWSAVSLAVAGAGTLCLSGREPALAGSFGRETQVETGASSLGKAPYRLMDLNGVPFDRAALKHSPLTLFFGFTHCLDVCPTTSGDIAALYQQLGAEASRLRTYLISVDLDRNTPEVLADYLSWNADVTGVTGALAEIARAAKSWGVYYEKIPDGAGGYTMEHASSVYLLDRHGELQTIISYEDDKQTALRKLRLLPVN